MKFETIHSQPIYQGRAFSVRQDQVRLPDGHKTNLDIVDHSGAVTILPIDSDGFIWFVRQYRHAAGSELLELPAGTLEPNESPQECADREIHEEIGMGSNKLQMIGKFFMAPGYSTELMYVYIATGLYEAPLAGDSDEFLNVERIPFKHIPDMIRSSMIMDGKTLAAFQLAKPYLPGPLD